MAPPITHRPITMLRSNTHDLSTFANDQCRISCRPSTCNLNHSLCLLWRQHFFGNLAWNYYTKLGGHQHGMFSIANVNNWCLWSLETNVVFCALSVYSCHERRLRRIAGTLMVVLLNCDIRLNFIPIERSFLCARSWLWILSQSYHHFGLILSFCSL